MTCADSTAAAGVAASDIVRAGLSCPSREYWLAAASMAPITLAVLAGVRHQLLSKQEDQQQLSQGGAAAPAEGDVVWTNRTTIVYPAICTGVGVVAGMFGVGGGIIKVGGHWLPIAPTPTPPCHGHQAHTIIATSP